MRLLLRLTVVDDNGMRASVDRELPPATSTVTIDSEPAGLQLAFNGTTGVTPFTRTVILGSHNSIGAPSQVRDGAQRTGQRFLAWSDGEAQDHVVTPTLPAVRYLASFEAHPLARHDREGQLMLVDVPAAGQEAHVGYGWQSPRPFSQLVFHEGAESAEGGFFDSLRVEVHGDSGWKTVPGVRFAPAYTGGNGVPGETFVIDFEPSFGDAIRLIGRPGGPARTITVTELEVWGESAPAQEP
jgi:hypothetical protein